MDNNEHKFKVFVDEDGNFGDAVNLVMDEGKHLDFDARLSVTAELGNDETVFVNSLSTNNISIYHSTAEVDFAGSVLIGTVWALERLKNEPTSSIKCKRGLVDARQENGIYWIKTSVGGNIGNWDYEQLTSPEDVKAIDVASTRGWKKMVWAWVDIEQGLIRARTFADAIGMPEAQGNGSGAMNLASQLKRQITIKHGDGSVIYARSTSDNSAEVGGRVIGA